MKPGSPSRNRILPLALAAWGAIASASFGQADAARPANQPVTRLEGTDGGRYRGFVTPQLPGDPITRPVTQIDDRVRTADLDGPRLISLSVSRPMPLQSLLLLLVNGTPFSLVSDESVSGSFSGDLKDLTMRQAIEAVLFPRALDYDVQGSLIRVFPRKPSTRSFNVNYLNLRRTWQRGVRSVIAIPGEPPAADSHSAVESDLFGELNNGVRSLLSDSGRAHIDRTAGLVTVTDFEERLEQVGVYIEAVQLRATRQVKVDARVFEVALTDPAAASIDWNAVSARTGAAFDMTRGAAAGVRIPDFDALMRAIAEQGTVTMIASPHVVAMNNEPAVMRAGTQGVYFIPASRFDAETRASAANGQTLAAWTVLQGLTLTVTPQVAADGIVLMSVAPTYAQKTGESKVRGGGSVPVLHVSEADTLVRVRGGETAVIAGLLREREAAKPGTGLAGLFGSQTRQTLKTELVILLTATVVSPGAVSVASAR